jgi:hypothetical protein
MYQSATYFDIVEIASKVRPLNSGGGYVQEIRLIDSARNVFEIAAHGDSAQRVALPEQGQRALREYAEKRADQYLTALARIAHADSLADAHDIVAEILDPSDISELAA